MQWLPHEIILIIFDYILKITDKRRFSQTCVIYNNLTKKIINNIESTIEINHFNYNKTCGIEKFTLELCHDGYVNEIPKSYFNRNNDIIMDALAMYGDITLLKIAKKNGCKLIKKRYDYADITKNVCDYAIIAGKLDVYKWLKSKGHLGIQNACALSAAYGHVHILKWVRKHNFGWDERTCRAAARNGNLEILIWAREQKCPWDYRICIDAILNNHLDILKWAISNGCNINTSQNYYWAALCGHINIIKWLQEKGYVWDIHTTKGAASGGHLNLLKWLRENSCPWDTGVCEDAAQNGHLHIIRWAIKNGCVMGKKTLHLAIQNNHYNVVDYLRKKECPE